jgi:hypothetical protein
MARTQDIISAKVSLDAVKQLFLIVIGLAITDALTHTKDYALVWGHLNFNWLLLAGYLLLVFKITLGTINILDHVSSKLNPEWSQTTSLTCLSFLTTGLFLYGLGSNLQEPKLFCLFLLGLLFTRNISLFLCHKPWTPPRGWGLWILMKYLAIVLGHPGGWYSPSKDQTHYHALSEEQCQIKQTHYFWIRTNTWVMILLFLCLDHSLWLVPKAVDIPNPDIFYSNLFQLLGQHWSLFWGCFLMGWTLLDFALHRPYYFGQPAPQTIELVDY